MEQLRKSDYDFNLPKELIAQTPLTDRAASRLLVLHRQSGEYEHKTFRNIKDYLQPGDCLVLNLSH
ncbi:MAG: S-adenosylmethionine:tRNA ribosyltransferase-isomerase, partial [Lachnospiraceae bacterium]|nr:S-adenosylmethionine:tRNA ribosyltransferase-isomerase [Lachnospiraceae bacterium]